MKVLITSIALCAVLSIIGTQSANASSMLLLEVNSANFGGTFTTNGGFDSARFAIGYANPLTGSYNPLVGYDLSHSPGSIGTFTFTGANNADFVSIAASLTNGINEELLLSDIFLNIDGTPLAGSRVAGFQEKYLTPDFMSDVIKVVGSGPDLVGYDVQSITLTINELTATPGAAKADITWRVYGQASLVPEPATVWFWGGGLITLMSVLRARVSKCT